MRNRGVAVGAVAVVLAVWLVGAAVTKYSLEQMALFAPLAICIIGLTAAVVMLWVKVILQLRRERQARPSGRTN